MDRGAEGWRESGKGGRKLVRRGGKEEDERRAGEEG